MSSSKAFFAILCLLVLALFTNAEKPTDSRASRNDDSRSTDSSSEMQFKVPDELGGKTMDQWIADLSHRDPSVKVAAIVVIPQFRDPMGKAVPRLVDMLRDGDASVRVKAAYALRLMGILPVHQLAVIKGLGRCIAQDEQAVVRYEAAVTLMRFGKLRGEERVVIPELMGNVGSRNTFELRHICIMALITAGVDDKGPDPRVTDALILRCSPLRESADQVRLAAIMALGALGRPQRPADLAKSIGILKQDFNFKSRNRAIRMWTHVALMALENKVNETELKAIVKNLYEKEAAIRLQTFIALGALEDKAHAYVDEICTILRKEKDASVKAAAATALGRMGNKGTRVLNTLIYMTEDTDPEHFDTVLAACNGLAHLGANDADVVQAMEKVLDHQLKRYQKDLVTKAIEELKHPKKKPLKDPAKTPEKAIGVGRNK